MTRFIGACCQDGSFDGQLFAGELGPAQLEDMPLRLLQVGEDHVGRTRQLAATRLYQGEGPALVRPVHQQDMIGVGAGPAHDVEQVLEVRAVLAVGIGAEFARQIQPGLVETEHAQPFRPPTESPSTTNRRSSMTRSTEGASASRQIAIIRLKKTCTSPTRLAITTGRVMNSARLLRISGISRSFHEITNTMAP